MPKATSANSTNSRESVHKKTYCYLVGWQGKCSWFVAILIFVSLMSNSVVGISRNRTTNEPEITPCFMQDTSSFSLLA